MWGRRWLWGESEVVRNREKGIRYPMLYHGGGLKQAGGSHPQCLTKCLEDRRKFGIIIVWSTPQPVCGKMPHAQGEVPPWSPQVCQPCQGALRGCHC